MRWNLLLAVVGLVSGICAAGDPLLDGFRAPPREAKPHVWWHWMNGNVSKAGITADLEAMAKAGIGGAQIFDVSDGIPPGCVAFNSDLWLEMLKHANEEAKRLGIELCLANCSGWSSSGGPWVKPEDAEKDVVFAETVVKGGTAFNGKLPCAENPHGFYRDLKVLAFPRPAAERIAPEDYGVKTEIKGDKATIFFARSFPLSGVAVSLEGGGRHPESKVSVEVDEGAGFRATVKGFQVYPTRYGFTDRRLFIPVAAPHARAVRVTCRSSKGVKLMAVVPEARGRIVEEWAKTFVIRSRIVGHANPVAPEQTVDPSRIVDLTSVLGTDGSFSWQAPADADEWVVVRFGYAANGARNRPPTPAGDGLEVDKFSKAALNRFFTEGYVDRALRELGPVDPRGGVNSLIVDSFEVKSQNWTEGFEKIFAERKKYDLTKFLPVFTGRVVGSTEQTDAVLADFREVASELFTENYAAEFHRLCQARGLLFYLEGYGSSPCADLKYERHCDIPMGEYWANKNLLTGNCRFAGSVAHVWGHRFVASESFTTAETGRWTRDPFTYKAQGDRAFCAGVNRIIYHRWAHQPWTNPANEPGMTMGPHGSHFERTQTWWNDAAAAWLAYQSRCQWMLQQGVAASDLLVVAEKGTPSCGLDLARWHEYEKVSADMFGRGIQWDLCDEEALAASKVVDGETVTPSGAVYPNVIRLPREKPPRIEPDFDCTDEALFRALRWIHRRTASGDDIYFVALPNADEKTFEASFRVTGRRPEIWDPETGTVSEPSQWHVEGGRTCVTLAFKPSGAAFVVFRPTPTPSLAKASKTLSAETVVPVEGSWQVRFLDGRGAPSDLQGFPTLLPWNESAEPGIRFYSGSALYTKVIHLPNRSSLKHSSNSNIQTSNQGPCRRYILDLGDVKNIAVVTVNGKPYPVLWRPPFRLDITDAIGHSPFKHSPDSDIQTISLSIRVTNLWPNRLIGDDALACDAQYRAQDDPANARNKKGGIISIPDRLWKDEPSPTGRHTFTTWRHWTKDDQLLPSGLLGPVKLIVSACP